MDSTKLNKRHHKFFEDFPNIDLKSFKVFLENLELQMLNGNFQGISSQEATSKQKESMSTYFASLYNIFLIPNKDLYELLKSLRVMTKEACTYSGIDFELQRYYIWGWLNIDYNDESTASLDDFSGLSFHDHFGGHGAPFFHGYYAVNAENSYTPYLINGVDLFENKNINGRAIVSETGHPHTRGIWKEADRRITVAYDIAPLDSIKEMDNKWIPLF